ncbi:MAG: DUF485 domain-containing protein [Planctomycetes bacterium]|nr:DUF485 domain-containing protein [Planctomycetota bacterium]
MNDMPHHEDHPHVVSRHARYGLILFGVYVLLYGGFMFMAVFEPHEMGATFMGGVPLAILYGFALIGGAVILALLYTYLCRRRSHS